MSAAVGPNCRPKRRKNSFVIQTAIRRVRKTRLAALMELVILSRRKHEHDVRPKKGKMASMKLPETIQSAEGVINDHKAEDGVEL